MNLSFYNISKDQTQIIKAIAILAIVLHNYLHITNDVKQNEMYFDPDCIFRFLQAIVDKPYMFFNAFFSFFGHYGVQLFIFISGYGLTKQFLKKDSFPAYRDYIIPRLTKIYGLLIYGIIIYSVFSLVFGFNTFERIIKFTILSLSLLKTFSFKYLFWGIGPWWYFSLAVQLYLIFPFLYKYLINRSSKQWCISILFSYILIYLLFQISYKVGFPLFGNFTGHLPEFLLGIGLAMFPTLKITWKVILPTTVIFILSWFTKYFFPFSFLSVTILMLPLFHYLFIHLKGKIKNIFIFLGKISMFMFVINGPIRHITAKPLFGQHEIILLGGSIIHLFVVIGVSYLMYLGYNQIKKILYTKYKISI